MSAKIYFICNLRNNRCMIYGFFVVILFYKIQQITFSDILSLGKVGCPDCYNTFRQELRDTIRSIHGTAKHVGLTPERSTAITPEPQKEPSEEEMLRVALEAAIRDENYEEAARLRDRIKELKGEN